MSKANRTALILALGFWFCACAPSRAQRSEPSTLTLMPVPKSMRIGSGSLVLSSTFTFRYSSSHDGRLQRAVTRMLHQMSFQTGYTLGLDPVSGSTQATFIIDVATPGEVVQSEDTDESYSLSVDARHINLRAANDVGAIRGFQTLLQLIELEDGRYVLPVVTIADAPRFRWRSLLLDCSRHFEPVPVILRTLDGMEAVKLNVFHWHLSDDQGFRVESKRFPKLQQLGSDGQYYTQDQIRKVVAYAADRGIRVVPEFDMPGHASSWFIGYPELASAPGPYKPVRKFGLLHSAMDPTRESTYRFLDEFIREMTALFPDRYFHFGGDESRGEQWLPNRAIVDFMLKNDLQDPAALETYFANRVDGIIRKHGKHAIAWTQVFESRFGHTDFGPWVQLFRDKYGRIDFGAPTHFYNVPKDITVDAAGSGGDEYQFVAQALRNGYHVFLSDPYYLNHMEAAEDYYLRDPLPGHLNLTPLEDSNLLGAQICMWGEVIDPKTIDSVIWPRAAAIAERFWSPADVRDVNDMYRRLQVESLRLERIGLLHVSDPEMMRRNLAGTMNPSPLDQFASVIQPVPLRDRMHSQNPDQLMPLDWLVDAIVPDPPQRHEIALEVSAILADSHHEADRAPLEHHFREWQQLSVPLTRVVSGSPRMCAALPKVSQLHVMGTVGLAALSCLKTGHAQSAVWQQQALALISSAGDPAGQVTFTFLPSLRRLVLACGVSASNEGY